jgi:hypothetical protein
VGDGLLMPPVSPQGFTMGILHDNARCDDRRSEEIHDFKGLKS